jgi:hypothetical protein
MNDFVEVTARFETGRLTRLRLFVLQVSVYCTLLFCSIKMAETF